MLLIIDNYDSFTYNLVQYFQILGQEVLVRTNDQISLEGIKALNPNYLVISPGPNAPEQAGLSLSAICTFYRHLPVLGVCLGHQCLAQAFGATISQAPEILHGKTSRILHNHRGLFRGLPNGFAATRYHSLAIETPSLPADFAIDAWAETTIMAISHRRYPLFGVQFHPEAILTEHGIELLKRFLEVSRDHSFKAAGGLGPSG